MLSHTLYEGVYTYSKEDFYALPSIAAYCAREDHFPRRYGA